MRMKQILMTISLVVVLLSIPGCNKLENLSNSGTKLICIGITGMNLEGETGSTTIFSDVITSSGSIINDTGTVELTAALLDPTQTESTFYQDVTVDQIDVEYSRSDMANARQGVDIPFGFSQKVYAQVAIGETVEIPFILVQHVAKLESPLVELINYGQEKVLKLEVKCTIHSIDVGGNRLAPVVGYVSVWCANFADED